MESTRIAAIVATGIVAGFFNVTAGAGSFLAVPLLISLGLPVAAANGTNRVALIVQSLTTIPRFMAGGVGGLKAVWPICLVALPGAWLGATLAAVAPALLFKRALAVTAIAVAGVTMLRPPSGAIDPLPGHRYRRSTLLAFVAIGFYGGFIQAGIGFLIVFVLAGWERIELVKTHTFKLLIVMALQLVAAPVFGAHDQIVWWDAVWLSLAYSIGGWIGALTVLRSADRVLRLLFALTALGMAAKLWFST